MERPWIFEVRIPACNRPRMLRRALQSVVDQSYPHWKAIVLDDALSYEAKDVVHSIADDRITYYRNPRQYGAGRNIDQGFSPFAISGGDYACLLEDDNFWLPEFLSLIAKRLEHDKWNLILANQRISEEGVGLRNLSVTTRGGWFSDGPVGVLNLRARLLLMEGVSNGGLIWRLGCGTDLRVGDSAEHGLHEFCRSLVVRSPFLFIAEPQAVWTLMPISQSARASDRNRMIGRGVQTIRDYLLKTHGDHIVNAAKVIATKMGLVDRLVEVLAYSGYPMLAGDCLKRRRILACRAFVKGLAIRLVEGDPSKAFLRSLPEWKNIVRPSES